MATDWKSQKCGTCQFFVRVQVPGQAVDLGAVKGECRAVPPLNFVGVGPQGQLMNQIGYRPIEAAFPACGQYGERKEVVTG